MKYQNVFKFADTLKVRVFRTFSKFQLACSVKQVLNLATDKKCKEPNLKRVFNVGIILQHSTEHCWNLLLHWLHWSLEIISTDSPAHDSPSDGPNLKVQF